MHKNRYEKKSLINRNRFFERAFASVFFLLLGLIGSASAQEVKVVTPPSQPRVAAPKPVPTVTPPRTRVYTRKKRAENDQPTPAEKFIKTEPNVNVQLCVSEGSVRINGWDRNEIRAFVNGGSKIGFKVLQKSRTTQNPVWVRILGFDPLTDNEVGLDECLSGEQIEIDVPRGAVVKMTGRESEIRIESIAEAFVENESGDIFLSDIASGVRATTLEGDVSVENSGGSMMLYTTTGNILAFDVQPSKIGDSFKAKTRSGAVTLQSIAQRDVEVSSVSGTIRFAGEFSSGGRYNFGTTNGSILLVLPESVSCKVNATYGFGAFQSDIPIKDQIKVPSSQVQKLIGIIGTGDSTLNLTTYSGSIRIRKQ
jgi:Uncharacterized conserved protein